MLHFRSLSHIFCRKDLVVVVVCMYYAVERTEIKYKLDSSE